MRMSGEWYEVDGMDDPTSEVHDAIVTKERLALDWNEGGGEFHAVLQSSDGGYSYQGTFGEPRLDPNCIIEAWRYRSIAGDELFWVTWHRKDTGFGGSSMLHISGN